MVAQSHLPDPRHDAPSTSPTKSNKKGKNASSGPTLDDLRTVMADAPTEATHDAPDAKFASEHAQEALADLRSRPRWVATETTFNAVRHLRSQKRRGGDESPIPIPSQYRPNTAPWRCQYAPAPPFGAGGR